ncbi:MAG TPA: acyl-CoA dehydrogenase family protein [Candidatus Limnocylindrales bacterium]|nr:acyl-CoA dehydrogenase family protein [Candidatus Limnocylindrales bacterium]
MELRSDGAPDRLESLRPEVAAVLEDGLGRLRALGVDGAGSGDSDGAGARDGARARDGAGAHDGADEGSFDPRPAEALAAAGLQRLVVPLARGGLGASLRETALVLAALGAVDGSAALGLAMHSQILGGALQAAAGSWPLPLLREVLEAALGDDGWIGSAAAEERAGSPQRGARLDTTAELQPQGTYRIEGAKAWVTWLPTLRYLLVSARLGEGTGIFLLERGTPGLEGDGRFDALSLRASGSGHLRLDGVEAPAERLVSCREAHSADPRGPAPQAWFGLAVAATYLGIGEGARAAVAAFARERRPADAPRGIGALPIVAARLGRLDATLRVARLVTLETARRWDAAASDATARAALLGEVALAKLTATNAAVSATEEALRIAGGPGLSQGPLERAFRDARAGLIHPPLDDISYQSFARRLLEAPQD